VRSSVVRKPVPMRDVYFVDLGLLFLRIGIGGMLLGLHGWARLVAAFSYLFLGQKWAFVGLVQHLGFPMPAAFAVASALAESLGAALLVAGLGTRWAALVVAFNMAVAVGLQFSKGSNSMELPGVYLVALLALALAGAGKFSLDARRRK
jgi:putative oxidoreductase